MEDKDQEKNQKESELPEEKPESSVEDETIVESEIEAEPEDQSTENQKEDKHGHDGSRWRRLLGWYKSHKKISIPLTALVLALIVVAIPWTRYASTGLVVKKDLSLQVIDSTSNTPVSDAAVSAGSASGMTDGNGNVTLRAVKVGQHSVEITKKYYQDQTLKVLVPILKNQEQVKVQFVATGRQVKILVNNVISNEKLAGVSIKVADIEAKTDDEGSATIVLPAGSAKQKAVLSLQGYNESSAEIDVSGSDIKENKFKMTPAGKVYFLSKRTGKLNVMKVNLDGTDAKVVVEGSGNEQEHNTILLPSSDGKFVALLARRAVSDPTPQLYVFAAEDEKLLNADSGNAEFALVGWSGSRLVYTTERRDLKEHQLGKRKLKSYDASSGRITLLDQTEASNAALAARQTYELVTLAGSTVILAKNWYSDDSLSVDGKKHSLQTIEASGQNQKTIATYDSANTLQYTQHGPQRFYISQSTAGGAGTSTFYEYNLGSTPKTVNISTSQFYDDQHIYFFSPSGNKTMWAETRDGKQTFLVADSSGSNAKDIASLSEFSAEGWYGENYLLASKKGSELYIMSIKGGEPLKLTDFQSTYGYYH